MSRRPTKLLPHIRGADDFAAAFNVSRETIARLETYDRLLRQWQKAVNLVAAGTLDDIWHRHLADSAQLAALAPGARTWVDLGSGAGFPGLVIAILLAGLRADSPPPCGEGLGVGGSPAPIGVLPSPPPWPSPTRGEGTRAVTLIESHERKCAFLREVARQTGISPGIAVDILSTRIEAAATQARLYGPDVVSARALAPLDKLLGLAAPLFTPGTVGVFLKGRDAAAELRAAEKMWNFNAELVSSRTHGDARIVMIRDLEARTETKGTKP